MLEPDGKHRPPPQAEVCSVHRYRQARRLMYKILHPFLSLYYYLAVSWESCGPFIIVPEVICY